jgi:hypothetical protein
MKKFSSEQQRIETASALEVVTNAERQEHHAAYVGLDVHKDSIAVAVAEPGRCEPVYRGEIANKPKSVEKLVAKLSEAYEGALLQFCYEAGPCGYVLYRQILACGHDCQVVAPSRIPRAPGCCFPHYSARPFPDTSAPDKTAFTGLFGIDLSTTARAGSRSGARGIGVAGKLTGRLHR